MTLLLQRFIEGLQLRIRAPKTIQAYVLQVRKFAQHYGRSPEHLDAEQVHRYLLYLLHEKKARGCSTNQTVRALRFFYLTADGAPSRRTGKKRNPPYLPRGRTHSNPYQRCLRKKEEREGGLLLVTVHQIFGKLAQLPSLRFPNMGAWMLRVALDAVSEMLALPSWNGSLRSCKRG
jgi:Phage integrase, N-terminal SAM-like domain